MPDNDIATHINRRLSTAGVDADDKTRAKLLRLSVKAKADGQRWQGVVEAFLRGYENRPAATRSGGRPQPKPSKHETRTLYAKALESEKQAVRAKHQGELERWKRERAEAGAIESDADRESAIRMLDARKPRMPNERQIRMEAEQRVSRREDVMEREQDPAVGPEHFGKVDKLDPDYIEWDKWYADGRIEHPGERHNAIRSKLPGFRAQEHPKLVAQARSQLAKQLGCKQREVRAAIAQASEERARSALDSLRSNVRGAWQLNEREAARKGL